jgi:hypothetical protein
MLCVSRTCVHLRRYCKITLHLKENIKRELKSRAFNPSICE